MAPPPGPAPVNVPGPGADPRDWEREWAGGFARAGELLAWLGLDAGELGLSAAADQDFPFRITRSWAARIRRGDPADPLLRQVLPVAAETAAAPGFSADPVGERASRRAAGLLQKYAGRALLLTTSACAIHCRYCFRRAFPYAEHRLDPDARATALALIGDDPALQEVILSGGDPLALRDGPLGALMDQLGRIPHLRRIRIHTRLPVVLPARISDALVGMLAASRKPVVLVIHSNHAREVDDEVAAGLARLRGAGTLLLNQSVLLRGVNDSVDALADLSEALFAAGVLPYYLHQLDPVAGAAHFAVDDARAAALLHALSARLPGYLLPRLVREIEGAPAKIPLPPHPHVT